MSGPQAEIHRRQQQETIPVIMNNRNIRKASLSPVKLGSREVRKDKSKPKNLVFSLMLETLN